MSFTRCD